MLANGAIIRGYVYDRNETMFQLWGADKLSCVPI